MAYLKRSITRIKADHNEDVCAIGACSFASITVFYEMASRLQ